MTTWPSQFTIIIPKLKIPWKKLKNFAPIATPPTSLKTTRETMPVRTVPELSKKAASLTPLSSVICRCSVRSLIEMVILFDNSETNNRTSTERRLKRAREKIDQLQRLLEIEPDYEEAYFFSKNLESTLQSESSDMPMTTTSLTRGGVSNYMQQPLFTSLSDSKKYFFFYSGPLPFDRHQW